MKDVDVPERNGYCPSTLPSTTLSEMLVQIDRAIEQPLHRLDAALADIVAEAVHDPALLAGFDLAAGTTSYARHLIHAGSGYAVLAIVWAPGQMSPVHAHRTWCVLGMHCGWMTETLFRHGRETVDPIGSRQLFPGDVSHSPQDLTTAHRMANLGCQPAVSVHIYGAAFDRLGHDVNHVWTA